MATHPGGRTTLRPHYLVADVGATNARFAITSFDDGAVRTLHEGRLAHLELEHFDEALSRFLADCPIDVATVERACFGVAAPVAGPLVSFTNRDWIIDADRVAARLGTPVMLVNDLAAAAAGVDSLDARDLVVLQGDALGRPEQGHRLVIGAGTGLGVAYAFWDATAHRVVASEGGHSGFAPRNEAQRQLVVALAPMLGRVEAEHIVSGPGLARIYEVLRRNGMHPEQPSLASALARGDGPAAICDQALFGDDPLALAAVDLFVDCYGTFAGDQAMNILPKGGVFLVGAVGTAMRTRLTSGGFMCAFTDRNRFASLARQFPVALVINDRLALLGATRVAAEGTARSGCAPDRRLRLA